MTTGKLIVIESGTDGSGKTTQFELLYDRLKANDHDVHKIEFPDYKSDSSALVRMYLRGDFGKKPKDVNLYAASTFYAVDRFASFQQKWKSIYKRGSIILADRYTTSNMIHQASKIDDKREREAYLEWLRDLEFNKFDLPEPDLVVFLDMPPEHSIRFINKRNYQDIHEKDIEYLHSTYDNALSIAEKYQWSIVNCVENERVKSREKIHQEVYNQTNKILKGDF
ncbi:MAG: dTMP kinase [Halanaerobiales bacterium]